MHMVSQTHTPLTTQAKSVVAHSNNSISTAGRNESPGDLSPLPQITDLTDPPSQCRHFHHRLPASAWGCGRVRLKPGLAFLQCSKALQRKQITPYIKTKDEEVINS